MAREVIPSKGGAEYVMLLNSAIPADPGSPGMKEAISRIADALPLGLVIDSRGRRISEVLKENLDHIQFSEKKASLTKDERILLFEDPDMKTRTASYQMLVDRLADLQRLEDEKRSSDPRDSIKQKLYQAKIGSANLALSAVPNYMELLAIHKRLASQFKAATRARVEELLNAKSDVQTYPTPAQWMDDSGYLPLSFEISAPFKTAGGDGQSSGATGGIGSFFCSIPALDFPFPPGDVPHSALPSPQKVRIGFELKRVLIRPDSQALDLLLSDSSWSWKGDGSFSSGDPDNGGAAGPSLITGRIHSLLVIRRLRITGPFDPAVTGGLTQALGDADRIPCFVSLPLRAATKPGGDWPAFSPALSPYEIGLSQPLIIGAIASWLPKR